VPASDNPASDNSAEWSPDSGGDAIPAVLRLVQAHSAGGAALLIRSVGDGGAEIIDAVPDRGQAGATIAGFDADAIAGKGAILPRFPLAFTEACGRRPGHIRCRAVRENLYLLVLVCSEDRIEDELLDAACRTLAVVTVVGRGSRLERDEQARFAAMVRYLPTPFIFVDWQEQEVFANQGAVTLLGLAPLETRASVIVGALSKLIQPKGGAALRLALDEQGRGAATFGLDHDGRTYKVETHWVEGGPLHGRVWTFHDVTDERELEDELRRLSSTDFLTNALNRRAFELGFRSELERAHRFDLPLSLIMLDLDHFKAINDTYGHEAGDEVLRETCRRVSAVLRDGDRVARLGGEEFGILMSEATPAQAQAIAERVRLAVGSRPIDLGHPVTVTCSLGATSRRGRDDDRGAMMERADAALYRAKSEGRNCVRTIV
jgi:diguanylate cyclase (GGDEF)-like protein